MAAYTVLILVATFIGHLSGSAASDEGGWIHLFTYLIALLVMVLVVLGAWGLSGMFV